MPYPGTPRAAVLLQARCVASLLVGDDKVDVGDDTDSGRDAGDVALAAYERVVRAVAVAVLVTRH